MIILTWRSVMRIVKTMKCPPIHLTSKTTIVNTFRGLNFSMRHARRTQYEIPQFDYQWNVVVPMLSLNTHYCHLAMIQLGHGQHHWSHVQSQLATTYFLTLTIHFPSRYSCYLWLVVSRMLHVSRQVEIRTIHHSRWLLLSQWQDSCRQSYSARFNVQ